MFGPRIKVTGFEFEDVERFGPGLAERLERRFPAYGFEVFGEIVCRPESKNLGLQAFQVLVVERLDGGFLDGSVHAFGLAIGPR